METIKSIIPILTERGIQPEEYSDFSFAMKVVTLQTAGMSLQKALEQANADSARSITKQEYLSIPAWKRLNKVAQNIAFASMQAEIKGITSAIVEQWSDAVGEIMNIILNGRLDRDKIEAFKALQEHFISRVQDTPETDNDMDQAEYLKRNRNFSPRPIAIQVNVDNGHDTSTHTIEILESGN